MSYLEEIFHQQLTYSGLPEFLRESTFHPTRKWRFDFSNKEFMIAVEIEGGIFLKGSRKSRHTTGKGFQEDCVKYNSAVILGWKLIRVTADDVKSGRALQWTEELLDSC